jgi:hypothetical protein
MRRVFGFGILLAGLALAGCGDATPVPAGSVPVPVSPAPTGAASTPAGPVSPSPGGVLVEFGRQGGLAGLSDQLVIGQDGGFTLVRARPAGQRSGRLTATELSDLRGALDRSNFAGLPADESATGSDLFTYHLTYAGSRITAQDGGVAAPLQPVIGALTAIVAKYGS